MISIKDLHKGYLLGDTRIPVLHGISLDIASTEFVAIMGPSGSGKSTLLNIIGCLDTADRGTYMLGDVAVADAIDDKLAHIRNSRLGFVFQTFNLIPRINAARNVELPMIYAGVPPAERKRRTTQALDRVALSDRAEHSPAQLSGGQQQRVAIARALVNEPDVIIADEPTGSLDSTTSHEIMELFTSLRAEGKTIVMVTHESEIAAWADRTIYLRDGVVSQMGVGKQ